MREEFKFTPSPIPGDCGARISFKFHPTYRVGLAEKIIGTIALAMADTDGEDSAGRQKLRLMAPEQVAERAISLADSMATLMEERGWFVPIPEFPPTERPARRGALGPSDPITGAPSTSGGAGGPT